MAVGGGDLRMQVHMSPELEETQLPSAFTV